MAMLQMQLPAWPFSSVRIMDISATGMQLHLRMLQIRQWPWQVTYLRQNMPPASHAHAVQYIQCVERGRCPDRAVRVRSLCGSLSQLRFCPRSYHNTIWLVLNDIIFGIVLGHFLRAHADTIGHMLAESIRGFTIDHVEMMVRWLMGWPSGIKLNNNLDAFFGNVCLTFLAIWRGTSPSHNGRPHLIPGKLTVHRPPTSTDMPDQYRTRCSWTACRPLSAPWARRACLAQR